MWTLVVVALATLLAVAVTAYPTILLAVVAVPILYGFRHHMVRLAWVLAGGLLVLQSSAGLNASKLVYLGGVILAAAVALPGAVRTVKSEWGHPAASMIRAMTILLALVVTGSIVAVATSAVSPVEISRDALTYLLAVPAVIVAIDAGSKTSVKAAEWIIIAVTIVSAVAFAVAWLGRRGATGIDTDQFALASVMLLAPGVALGVVRGASPGWRNTLWLLLPAIAVSAVLITGSRSGLVLLAAFVGVAGSNARSRVPARRVMRSILGVAAVAALALGLAASALGLDQFLAQRVSVAQGAIQNGWAADSSGSIRLEASRIALGVWEQNFWFGVGFGQQFVNPSGVGSVSFQIDTPFLFLAKFGLFGTVLVASVIFITARVGFKRLTVDKAEPGWVPEQAVIRGTSAIWLTTLIFGAFTEDKGFALSLPLLTVLLVSRLRSLPQSSGPETTQLDSSGTHVPMRFHRAARSLG